MTSPKLPQALAQVVADRARSKQVLLDQLNEVAAAMKTLGVSSIQATPDRRYEFTPNQGPKHPERLWLVRTSETRRLLRSPQVESQAFALMEDWRLDHKVSSAALEQFAFDLDLLKAELFKTVADSADELSSAARIAGTSSGGDVGAVVAELEQAKAQVALAKVQEQAQARLERVKATAGPLIEAVQEVHERGPVTLSAVAAAVGRRQEEQIDRLRAHAADIAGALPVGVILKVNGRYYQKDPEGTSLLKTGAYLSQTHVWQLNPAGGGNYPWVTGSKTDAAPRFDASGNDRHNYYAGVEEYEAFAFDLPGLRQQTFELLVAQTTSIVNSGKSLDALDAGLAAPNGSLSSGI